MRGVNPKIGTGSKLSALIQLGYLSKSDGGFYYTAPKGFELLEKEGFNTRILQKNLTGNYSLHQERLTDLLLIEMEKPNYYAIIYPSFTYKNPDACIIWKRDNQYKLEFIELELSPKDSEYLPNKKAGYERLARDVEIYSVWWKTWSSYLKLPYCKLSDFCFGVRYE